MTVRMTTTDHNEELTAPQAADEYGMHRATTSAAAKAGEVPGARQIGPVWVAPRAAWAKWHSNRRPSGPVPGSTRRR